MIRKLFLLGCIAIGVMFSTFDSAKAQTPCTDILGQLIQMGLATFDGQTLVITLSSGDTGAILQAESAARIAGFKHDGTYTNGNGTTSSYYINKKGWTNPCQPPGNPNADKFRQIIGETSRTPQQVVKPFLTSLKSAMPAALAFAGIIVIIILIGLLALRLVFS